MDYCVKPPSMEALQFDPTTKKLELVYKAIPKIDEEEILIKVHYAGVCGTDLNILAGVLPCTDMPFILGHELCGVVAQIGKKVEHVKVGDKVAIDPNRHCTVCEYCRAGTPNYCVQALINGTLGVYADGGWAEYCSVSSRQAYKIPDTVTLQQAALCEPLSCVMHAIQRVAPIYIGQRILILGAGIAGLSFTILLHLRGHIHVTVSEPNEARLLTIKKIDAKYQTVHPSMLVNSSMLFDVIIDCSGNEKAIEQAFTLLDYGGRFTIYGVPKSSAFLRLPAFDLMSKELTVRGTCFNPFVFSKTLMLIEAMGERYINYEKLGIRKYSLGDFTNAIEAVREGRVVKAMFYMKP